MDIEQEVAPVAQGYAYAFRLKVTGGDPAFPVGATFRADVRAWPGAPLAGALTTEAGSLVRIDGDTIEVQLASAVTAAIFNTVAHLDFVRTDLSPDVWMGVQVRLPVVVPITQPGADA